MRHEDLISALEPGAKLPVVTGEAITRERILDYAGASGDYNPMHVDEVINVAGGGNGIFAHGMLGTGILGRVVTDVVGDIPLTALGVRCSRVVRPGDVLTCSGTVESRVIEAGAVHVTFALRAVDQNGQTTHHGSAAIELPLVVLNHRTGAAIDAAAELVRWRAIG